MRQLRMIARLLGESDGNILLNRMDDIAQIRLRTNHPLQVSFLDGTSTEGMVTQADTLKSVINTLMENSLYAWENELKQGYFTAEGGMRVGVCGRINAGNGGVEYLNGIASVCIRIPHAVYGCADALLKEMNADGLENLLILSPPGLGKTTLLREYIRNISESGFNVGLADERREVAACTEGLPQLDVGRRTDVLDGCPKALGIPMLVRSCSPDLIAVDEIGGIQDARAIQDACNCGVAIVASAHASGVKDAWRRNALRMLLENGVFHRCVVLGPGIGSIKAIFDCRNARFEDAEGCAAVGYNALLRRGGQNAVQCAAAACGNAG